MGIDYHVYILCELVNKAHSIKNEDGQKQKKTSTKHANEMKFPAWTYDPTYCMPSLLGTTTTTTTPPKKNTAVED